MAENIVTPASAEFGANRFKEAVCIEAGRIFDSCSDKDCLEDLQVFFGPRSREIINASTLIKCRSAEVLDVAITVEPVPFNKGFFAADLTFYFRVHFSAYESKVCTPTNVCGLAVHSKKVILYGSEGNVKTFHSGEPRSCSRCRQINNLPTACVKVVDPIVLGSRIVDSAPAFSEPLGVIPEEIAAFFDETLEPVPDSSSKVVLVTLGVFTIVTMQRDVQLMIPAYDYVLPEKDCVNSVTSDDPCEMFKRIKFPVNEFFPDDLCDVTEGAGGCEK